jgi:cadmium resistance protein CadD (predicted permease)
VSELLSLLGVGIGAFVATNIDDTFVLILLFSSPYILARNVIIGQFLGIVLLVLISSLASLLALAVPPFVIGLMGLIPIIIGIKRLLKFRKRSETNYTMKKEYLSFLSVAAITIANGGDDIGVFTPLFAKYNTAPEVTILVTIFLIMTGIWCLVTYYFMKHPFIASRVKVLSHVVTPIVLIGLGIYIILDSFVFSFVL